NGAFNFYMKSKLVMSRIPDLPLHKAQGLAKQVKSKVNDLEYLIVDYVGRMEVKNYHGSSSLDRKSTRLNSSHVSISYAVFCLKKKISMQVMIKFIRHTTFWYWKVY